MPTSDQQAARNHLLGVFGTPDRIINAAVMSVNSDGTMRKVQVYVPDADGRVWDASIVVARAIGRRYSDPRHSVSGVICHGAGLNAAHEVAHALHMALWGHEARDRFRFNQV